MRSFRSRQHNILVATDIVARGIDVSGVSHVINFDVPDTPEAYTHRLGRTGRAERRGEACTFVTADDSGWMRATERMIGSRIPTPAGRGLRARYQRAAQAAQAPRQTAPEQATSSGSPGAQPKTRRLNTLLRVGEELRPRRPPSKSPASSSLAFSQACHSPGLVSSTGPGEYMGNLC